MIKVMNKINQYTKGLFLSVLAVAGLTLTSCKDQPDAYKVADGTPSINYVRCLSTEITTNRDAADMHYTNGELVESASPQNTLCLVGENLRSVYELYFNDCKAILNTSYITDNTLIVDVPKSVPKLVTNKIYMVTKSGETVDYDFTVEIPAPSISAMSCEYAAIGDRVTFTGDYFVNYEDSPLEVFFTDANDNLIPAEINSIADDYTSVEVTIPEGAAKGPVYMSSIYGLSSSAFYYLDNRGMMFDFETIADGGTGLGFGKTNAWHERPIVEDEKSITGHYMIIGDGTTKQEAKGGFTDGTFSFEYWCGTWNTPQSYPKSGPGVRLHDLEGVDFSKPENMILKFELCIPSSYPCKTGGLQILFASEEYVSMGNTNERREDEFGKTIMGCNNIYFRDASDGEFEELFTKKDMNPLPRAIYRPWTTNSTGSFDTGDKWITVSIPIASSFIYNYDGSGLTFNLTKESDYSSFQMILVGGGSEDSTPMFYIDNIRVIPNK